MAIWSAIKTDWSSFEGWLASWMPGLKTYIVNGLGAVGSLALVLQEYVSGLPLSEFMTGTQIAVATSILFTLGFWFHNMSARNNVSVSSPVT